MLEINECRASADLVQCFIEAMKSNSDSSEELLLSHLWSDPTEEDLETLEVENSLVKPKPIDPPALKEEDVDVLPLDTIVM